MKTRTNKYKHTTTSKQDLLHSIKYQEPKEVSDPLIRFFPAVVSGFLLFIFSLVTYSAYKGEMIYISIIFFMLTLTAGIYTLRKIIVIKSPYTFYWNQRNHGFMNVKNSYNYTVTPELEKITKSKFWKFIYFSEYYYKILFSILGLPLIGIFIILFILESFGALPSTPFILTIIFGPAIYACIKLIISMLKMRSQIFSDKNNFYYISRNSKNLGFTIKNNIQGGGDYYFQK